MSGQLQRRFHTKGMTVDLVNGNQPAESGQHDAGCAQDSLADEPSRRKRSLSARVVLSGTVLALAAAGIAWLVLPHGSSHPTRGAAPRPSVPVGYAVDGTGTARITYVQQDGTNRTFTARLPWQQSTALTSGSPATLAIVLGPGGGRATCTLTVHGKPVQHATAYGTYGRATCRSAASVR